jgi:hypothetical protein
MPSGYQSVRNSPKRKFGKFSRNSRDIRVTEGPLILNLNDLNELIWWRRGESNYGSLLKTPKLLKIRGAQHARNAEKAVRMYAACTRSSDERVASFLWGMLTVVAFKSPFRSYLSRDERVRKNSAGVAIRSPVRFATACVKCLVLCVSNQSGLLNMAERSTGTSAACLIR